MKGNDLNREETRGKMMGMTVLECIMDSEMAYFMVGGAERIDI